MNEPGARQLAKYIRENVPGAVAIATRETEYLPGNLIPYPSRRWVVVANGTIIRDPKELQA